MKTITNLRKRLALLTAGLLLGSTAFSQARVQIIHNSADAATQIVDVYAGTTLLLNDFEFRTASPFVDVVAGTVDIGVAPSNSTSVNDTVVSFPLTVVDGETYVVVANGILSATGYAPAPAVELDVYPLGRESSAVAGNTDVLVCHGATDAPVVDVVEVTAGTVVDDIAYGEFQGYLELPNADYTLNVTDATGATVVKSYDAPLATLTLADEAIVVVASGFLDPSVNSNGADFGLWVALPVGGDLIALPESKAKLQVIHNSADLAAALVDVYLNGDLLIDDFAFRTATPFVDVPGEVTNSIAIAPSNSTSVAAAIATIPATFSANETYVAVANGIVSPTGYAPATAFSLDVFEGGREASAIAGNTDVLVHHGSTDAPDVDVVEVTAGTVVDDITYGGFDGYLELANLDYTLNVTDVTGATVVKSYAAPLNTLALADQALVVVASGFLDPSANSNGSDFGLWVALPTGGSLIELPESEARLQVIHNSADALAAVVDVYFNGALLIDDFAFRTASPFIDVPAEVENSIAIAPGNSTSVAQAVATIPASFTVGETFVAIANGIVSPVGYTPATAFSLDVFGAREAAAVAGNTDVLVFHGSTDAPTVDVVEVTAGLLVDDASYGDFAGYLELPNADYTLNVTDGTGATVVRSYGAPLNTLALADEAIIVVASGFLDPSVNSNGEEFGLWVALPTGGQLVELPESQSRLQVIHNSADAAASVVDIYLNGSLLLDDFAFRTATPFVDVPAERENSIAVAPGNSTSVADAIATIPAVFSLDETYIAIANGIVSTSGYSPVTPFSLDVFPGAREVAAAAGNTDVLVFHGSTDAPTVDVDEVTAGNLVNDASYGDFAGYLELATNDYTLQVKDGTGTTTLFQYGAPLAGLGLQDQAIAVLASGFVDPSANSNGEGFGLWAALASGGALVELPTSSLSVTEFGSELNIFPNPTTGLFQINGIENGSTIEIFDIAGKTVLSEIVNDTQILSLEGFKSGTYMLKIQTAEQQVIRKIVLQ